MRKEQATDQASHTVLRGTRRCKLVNVFSKQGRVWSFMSRTHTTSAMVCAEVGCSKLGLACRYYASRVAGVYGLKVCMAVLCASCVHGVMLQAPSSLNVIRKSLQRHIWH